MQKQDSVQQDGNNFDNVDTTAMQSNVWNDNESLEGEEEEAPYDDDDDEMFAVLMKEKSQPTLNTTSCNSTSN